MLKLARFLNVSIDKLVGFKVKENKRTDATKLLNIISETKASTILDKNRQKFEEEWNVIVNLGIDDIIYKPFALMNRKEPCIYLCFDDNDIVIYVGRTIGIVGRINNHQSDTHWWEEVRSVFFAQTKCQTDMAIYELYYINKFKPKYNSQNKFNDCCSLKLNELV